MTILPRTIEIRPIKDFAADARRIGFRLEYAVERERFDRAGRARAAGEFSIRLTPASARAIAASKKVTAEGTAMAIESTTPYAVGDELFEVARQTAQEALGIARELVA